MAARLTPEARRRAVLEAAVKVFAQHGFDAATTEEIARVAGLSKGGLYWHFKSKDEILAAILVQLFDQEMVVLKELVAAGGPVAARLRRLAVQSAGALLEMEQALPVALEFYALAARNPSVRQALQEYYQRYHALLTALLQQGVAAGELHGSAEAAAVALIAQVEGLGLLWAIAPHLVRPREQAELAVELLLKGLTRVDQ